MAPTLTSKRSRYGRKNKKYNKRYNRYTKRLRYTPVGLPNNYTCKMKYCDTFTLTTTGGAVRDSITAGFKANSCYDPRDGIGGHQPLYFDQIMALYNHGTVIASKIRVYPVHPSNSSIVPFYWGVALCDDATALDNLTIDAIMEQEHRGSLGLSGLVNMTDPRNKPRKQYFSQKKFFNEGKTSYDAEYNFDASADATELAHYVIYMCNGTDPDVSMNFFVEIDYIVRWHEPKTVTQS